MKTWRMAFRAGKNGPTLWPECRRLGIAAIQYDPLNDIDLSLLEEGGSKEVWSKLQSTQKRSVKRLVYEIEPGDEIVVKEGPKIVGRGVVTGPYHFAAASQIAEPSGVTWQHHRPVDWEHDFPEITIKVGSNQMFVVDPLIGNDMVRIELALQLIGWVGEVPFVSPDEVSPNSDEFEGAARLAWVNRYERSVKLRGQCIAAQGTICVICGFNFGAVYGPVADGYIHVHHIQQLSIVGKIHCVNPLTDLRPVCPNCHAVLHRRTPPFSIEEVAGFIKMRVAT